MRYGNVFQAFLSAEVPLIKLKPGDKRPFSPTAVMSRLATLSAVETALQASANIGAVTHLAAMPGANPLRFADLDVDRWDPKIDLSPYSIRVRREGQDERAHYWLRLPGNVPMITAKDARGWDILTWNTVMPASVHRDGSTYLLERRAESEWIGWEGDSFSVLGLPEVDPFAFLPPIQRKPKKVLTPGPGVAWKRTTGTPFTRLRKAEHYLRHEARSSVSGQHGHDALLVVVCNLRLFHGLDWPIAYRLLRECYDGKCLDDQGRHYPWTDEELRHKWDEAGKPEAYPNLALTDPKTIARAAANALQKEVRTFLDQCTDQNGDCEPTTLRHAFIAWRGGALVNPTAFGRAVHACLGGASDTSGGGRRYQGCRLK